MPIETRLAALSDCKVLTDLCFRSKQSNGYDDAFMNACRQELAVTANTLQENECWVVQRDQDLCGCGCLAIDSVNCSGEISLFFVDPARQRQGVGTALWKILLQRARQHNLKQLLLDADPAAVPFYTTLGFTITDRVPSGSIPGRFLQRMQLTIT